MRSLADGSSGSSNGAPRRPEPPQRRGALGRLKRLLAALAATVYGLGPVTLRRLLTVGFMFCLGSVLSLASNRGRCAGPQEVCAVGAAGEGRRGGSRGCKGRLRSRA